MAKGQDGDDRHHPHHRAHQRAPETILNMLDLSDGVARPLLDWGVAQVEAAADDLPPGRWLDAAGDMDLLARRAAPVCRVIKVVSSLVADRRTLEPGQVAEELALVLDLADRLPRPPVPQARAARSSVMADLAAWQTEMDDRTFVRSVLALLQGPRAGSAEGPVAESLGWGDVGQIDNLPHIPQDGH